jgi:hypothetical protein
MGWPRPIADVRPCRADLPQPVSPPTRVWHPRSCRTGRHGRPAKHCSCCRSSPSRTRRNPDRSVNAPGPEHWRRTGNCRPGSNNGLHPVARGWGREQPGPGAGAASSASLPPRRPRAVSRPRAATRSAVARLAAPVAESEPRRLAEAPGELPVGELVRPATGQAGAGERVPQREAVPVAATAAIRSRETGPDVRASSPAWPGPGGEPPPPTVGAAPARPASFYDRPMTASAVGDR